MAVYYAEFDTTVQNLIKDIKTRVLLNPDWSWQGLDTQIVATSANAAVGAQSVSITNGTLPAGLQVGQVIRIGNYSGNHEYRTVTSFAATSISFSNGQLVNSYPSGTPIFWGNEVLRTTTVRGASMILDLTAGMNSAEQGRKIGAGAYGGFTPGTTTAAPIVTGGASLRSAYFRRGNTAYTAIAHCVVSTSKDHIYISVEGPRMSEPLTANTNYGSTRGYVFMSDLVPYSSTDTIPVVVFGGQNTADYDGGSSNKTHTVATSKSIDGLATWVEGTLLALTFPTVGYGLTVGPQRMTSIDGTDKYYLSPYVLASNECGLRGRLSSFFFAGTNFSNAGEQFNPAVGSEVVYNGVTYKLLAVSKSEGGVGSTYAWGSFGAAANGSSDHWLSPIVAIPVA